MHVAKVLTTSITGIALAFSMLASTIPANAAVGYHASYFSESDFLARNAGQTGQFAVGYSNTGDRAWVSGAAGQQANLATAAPLDNTNDFAAGWSNGWLSANRYAAQNVALVAPGQVGFFIYNFTVPATAAAGEHRFYGREVIDGVTFMEDFGYYQSVTVGAAAAAPVLTSLTPNGGSNAGGTSVTIAGTGFICTPTTPTVNFGATAGTVTSCGATSLVVTSPAGTGTVSVTAANTGGVASNALDYIYADTTKPVFSGITADGNTITLTFSKAVCASSALNLAPGTDFTVTVNNITVTPTAETSTLCNATFDNGTTTFVLTVGTQFVNGDQVGVTLTTTGGGKLRDTAGNTANAQLRTATATADTTKPFMTAAAATSATTLKLTYSEAVTCSNAVTAAQQFATGGGPTAATGIACALATAFIGSKTVTLTFPAATFTAGVGGSVTYTQGVTADRIKDRSANDATSPQTISYTAFATDTVRPLSQDIRIKTKVGSSSTLNVGDVFTVAFNEVMAPPAAGAKIRFQDAGAPAPSVADVICGTNATCALSPAALTIGTVSYPTGQVITVTMTAVPVVVTAGTNPILQIPATAIDSGGFTDVAGNQWDIVNSPDKILN